MEKSILISGGHVIDPAAGVDYSDLVAIEDGKIVCADTIHPDKVIDAEGCYVFPGFIDFHTHLYGGSAFGIEPELFLSSGVTSAVDAGTAGVINFDEFYCHTIRDSRMHIKAFLNISGIGQPGGGILEPLGNTAVQWDEIGKMLDRYSDVLLGVKLRISKPIVRELGLGPLERTIRFVHERGLPMNVHVTNPPEPLEAIIPMFRKGDIFCHVFHGTGYTILNEKGHVGAEFWKAKERGVLFDSANGRSNFSFKVATEAVKEGFFPDIISTDATAINYNHPEQVKNLPFLMSKYLSMGMSLPQVVKAVTAVPAAVMGMEGKIGTLKAGACGDVVICRRKEKTVRFRDSDGELYDGNQVLEPVLVILNGRIVYRNPGF